MNVTKRGQNVNLHIRRDEALYCGNQTASLMTLMTGCWHLVDCMDQLPVCMTVNWTPSKYYIWKCISVVVCLLSFCLKIYFFCEGSDCGLCLKEKLHILRAHPEVSSKSQCLFYPCNHTVIIYIFVCLFCIFEDLKCRDVNNRIVKVMTIKMKTICHVIICRSLL